MRWVRALLIASLCIVPLSAKAWWQSIQQVGVSGGGGGGCSQATAFLARNGNAHPTQTTTLICGLVTSGIFAKLDALYIFSTSNTTAANLNLISTSYGITTTAAPTFTTDYGYTGDEFTNLYLDTNFIPSTGGSQYTLNSGSFGVYALNSRTGTNGWTAMGVSDAGFSNISYLELQGGGGAFDLNGGSFPSLSITNIQGAWAVSRTSSSLESVYLDGTLTPFATDAGSSTGLASSSFWIFGINNGGTIAQQSSDTLGAAWIGSGLTATEVVQLHTYINGYMATLPNPINVYPYP